MRLRHKSTHRMRYVHVHVHVCYSYKIHYLSSHSVLLAVAVLHEGELWFCLQRGWTALHLAAQEGKADVVRLLTEAKAHVNIQTKVHIYTCMYVCTRST